MTTTNTTAVKTAPTQTTVDATQAMTDAVKMNMEAGQKMVATFTEMFTKGWGVAPVNTMPTMTMPGAFEKVTKTMTGLAEANAAFVTEVGTLMAETVRSNAVMIERTNEVVVAQITGKTVKPAADTVREIVNETTAFGTKVSERVTKMNAAHGQRIAKIMEETMVCKNGCTNN